MIDKKYAPIEYVMARDSRTRKYFENILRSSHNHERVIRQNGKIFVDINYTNPLTHKLYDLLCKAEEHSKNLRSIAIKLAEYEGKSDPNAYYLYFRYGSFKHHKKALRTIFLLEKYLHDLNA